MTCESLFLPSWFLRGIQEAAEHVCCSCYLTFTAKETINRFPYPRRQFFLELIQHDLDDILGCLFGQARFLHHKPNKFFPFFILR